MRTRAKIEFGDFQTPLALAREICRLLAQKEIKPEVVLEPTCGVGAFLVAAAEVFPNAHLLGWDINHAYVQQAAAALAEAGALHRARLGQRDFFAYDWDKEIGRAHV